jgi:hypothetical protein
MFSRKLRAENVEIGLEIDNFKPCLQVLKVVSSIEFPAQTVRYSGVMIQICERGSQDLPNSKNFAY